MPAPICSECRAALAPDADPRRFTCSDRCRTRRSRRLATERAATTRASLADLFAALRAAALSGDLAALAEAERRASRLLAG
ncbi:hypothetical protein Q6346_04850 [Isoptericola sp. b490]|nr:hypothetical protein [Isoptericola sp. b490]